MWSGAEGQAVRVRQIWVEYQHHYLSCVALNRLLHFSKPQFPYPLRWICIPVPALPEHSKVKLQTTLPKAHSLHLLPPQHIAPDHHLTVSRTEHWTWSLKDFPSRPRASPVWSSHMWDFEQITVLGRISVSMFGLGRFLHPHKIEAILWQLSNN